MKKILSLCFILISVLALSSCKYYQELIILNWQDYISLDLIQKFEEENDCIVRELAVTSNEQMYTDILNRKVAYDIAIPSDYMIDKLHKADLLKPLDFDLLPNYQDDMFVRELTELMNDEKNSSYKGYYIPYFWGSLGIMYSTKNIPNMKELVEEYGFSIFFEDVLPANAKLAMYDSSRDSFAAAEIYLGYSLNTEDEKELKEAAELIKSRNFKNWGTDELKIQVSAGNLDAALVYSGDYFDAFYSDLELGDEQKLSTYGIYAPTKANNVFYDGMVIPITSQETELAHKFINFMLDEENNYENTDAVGYCPTLQSVYDDIFSDPEWEDITSIEAYNPALICHEAGKKAEVYRDLGKDAYKLMEQLYTEIRYI